MREGQTARPSWIIRDGAAEGGEQDQALANLETGGLGEATAVDLELWRVVGSLHERRPVADRFGLVVDDDQRALLLEHELDLALEQPRPVGEPELELAQHLT